MDSGERVFLKCRIARGGFSGERIFRLALAEGAEHAGVAPVEYCFRPALPPIPVGPDEPAKGQPMDGLIEGRVIRNGGDVALVAIPDGETVEVRFEAIALREVAKTEYVPVGS